MNGELQAYTADNIPELRAAVHRIVDETSVTDIHTHLYAPHFGEALLYGIDELLTYHYLIAETLRVSEIPYASFWALSKQEQADLVWKALFVDRTPLSEACRGVLTSLQALGLDPGERDLGAYRSYFASIAVEDHVDTIFKKARLKSVIMTNDPFDERERAIWQNDVRGDKRFQAAVRIDPLLLQWPVTCGQLKGRGYGTDALLSKTALDEVHRFLDDWVYLTKARYMAISLPPTFTYPEESASATLLEQCVLPVAKERNIPFAMMIGVNRGVNADLRLAGDAVGQGNVRSIERLCAKYPENKFMVTMLSRENQHELCVAARKFRNLHLFGCWWFLNNPSLINEITRMRIELLGLSMTPQHSDARVLEQVLYKWNHSRAVIGHVLADKFADVVRTGWTVTEDEIQRDVSRLFGGEFERFAQ